jgi:glycosyltransferase involved in cell wall biosynthesis
MITLEQLLDELTNWRGRASPGLEAEAANARRRFSDFALSNAAVEQVLPNALFDPNHYYISAGLSGSENASENGVLDHYVEFGSAEGHDPTAWFSERFYRSAYHDVRAGIAAGYWRCAYHHYLLRGMGEHRSPSADFNELAYLGNYPDVLAELRKHALPSGFFHYVCLGQVEGRSFAPKSLDPSLLLPLVPQLGFVEPSSAFAENLYRHRYPDVGPGCQHWREHGLLEDLQGKRARIEGYIENIYLRENRDVAQAVSVGHLKSGYFHFLMYGASEGRTWAGSMQARKERAHLRRALSTRSFLPAGLADGASPLISILVPVFNPSRISLQACIDSVRTQTYQNWELCLTDDGSHLPEVTETLVAAEAADSRIHVTFAPRNCGISAASNLALAQCRGEFVALVDHDDLLAPDALLHVAHAFLSKPDVDLVYTDEGKLSEEGELTGLTPKPGWSPELLLSTMYIGHLTTYRRSLVEEVGGFRSMFDGSQDYDLALRVAEAVRSVVHVPLPLYFWRMSPTSTAGSLRAKPAALDAQRSALESALVRRQQHGSVRPGHAAGHWSVTLDVPVGVPLVSIVIPTAGRMATVGGITFDLLVNCVNSIKTAESYPHYEFVIVHNGDLRCDTLLGLSALPNIRFVHYDSENFNLSNKINLGVRSAQGEFVLLLNDDMQAESTDVIRSMLGRMFDGVGIVGARLLYANGSLQHAGIVWTTEGPTHAMLGEHRLTAGPAERLQIMHNCFGVSGACMFFRRVVFLENGGFSSRFPTNYNDVDICLRLRNKGLRVVFNPDVTLYHFESVSKSGTQFWELQLLLIDHPQIVDPYWNSTFSQLTPFYELRDTEAPEMPSYRAWLVQRILRRRSKLTQISRVRFSVFMSVYQTSRRQLEELEATMIHQSYTNWEWVIVDNGSTRPETIAWLDHARNLDKVKVVRLEANLGIMGGYGAAFQATTGDYVVPVDSDDFLTLDCLQVLATAIEAEDWPDAVYSDEDKANEQGAVHSPFLKPDWDPLLFTNICYVCHVCAIKRDVATTVDAYTDPDASGCHDWDTFLRLHRCGARIVHVPEVLYSWRIHAGSTASIETGNKPFTISSQKHVLDQHLRLTGLSAAFEVVQNELFPHTGIWRLKPRATAPGRSAVLVVASSDVAHLAAILLDLAQAKVPQENILIVGTTEQLHDALKAMPVELLGHQAVMRQRPGLTLSEALNLCKAANRETIAVIDGDVVSLNREWLNEGVGMFAVDANVGAVGGQVLRRDGRVAWRGGFYEFGGMSGSPDYGMEASNSGYHGMGWCQRLCDAIPAVCFFARADLLETAINALGDAPLSLRTLAAEVALSAQRQKLSIVYTPFVQSSLKRDVAVDPILPHRSTPDVAVRPSYYHSAFGRAIRTAYCFVAND